MMRIAFVFALLLAAGITEQVGLSAEVAAPADVQAKIFAKALEYDKNLPQKAKSGTVIGIVVKPGHSQSVEAGNAVEKFFVTLGAAGGKIAGLAVKTETAEFKDSAAFAAWLTEKQISYLFVAPGLSEELEAIIAACRAGQVGTLAGDETFVKKGLAFGVVIRDNRPLMLVNLKAASAEGSAFKAELLQLAEIVEK